MALSFGRTKLQKKRQKTQQHSTHKNSQPCYYRIMHTPRCELFHGGTIVFQRHHAEGNVQLFAY